MKNFKKVVFGLLAMLVMVTGVNAVYDEDIVSLHDLAACLTSTEDSVYCKLTAARGLGDDYTIKSKDLTLVIADNALINMGASKTIKVADGAKLTIITEGNGVLNLSKAIEVETGGSLVVKGKVTQTVDSQGLIYVAGDTTAASEDPRAPHAVKTTSLVVDSSAVMTNTKLAGWGVSTVGYAQITLNGDWLTLGETVVLNGTSNAAVDINGGKYVSNGGNAIALRASTKADVVINDGTFKSTASNTIDVNGGSLTINKAVVDATNNGSGTGKAVHVSNASLIINDGTYTVDKTQVLHIENNSVAEINNGVFTSDLSSSAFATHLVGADAKVTVNGGEYTGNINTLASVKGVVAEGLTAVRIGNTVYVGKEHKLDIEVVEENGKKIELRTPQTLLGGHTYTLKYLEDNRYLKVEANEGYVAKYVLVVGSEQTLVKDGEFTMPDSDAKLVVTFVTPDELNQEMQNPVNPDNGGENDGEKGDENTNTNPGTFDGIATIVTMAVSSLSAAGYSIKKIVRK